MALLDLRGPVPNCGAHRVAWVILLADDPSGKMGELDQLLGANMAERLISGDLTPGMAMGIKIHRWSNGRIFARHFYEDTPKRWREPPHGFVMPRQRAAQRPTPPRSQFVWQGASFLPQPRTDGI